MTEAQIKCMVDRFLNWKLPADFNPDCGISFKKTSGEPTAYPGKYDNYRSKTPVRENEPTGTNLFDATQAKAMVLYMLEAMPSDALTDVATERERQMTVEGWTPEHDDCHQNGELATAAACYIRPDLSEVKETKVGVEAKILSILHDPWPFQKSWWKPQDRRRDLVRAGALIVAEIERLDRARSRD